MIKASNSSTASRSSASTAARQKALEPAEPLRRQCLEFLRAIETRARPITDGESGLRVLRVLDAAERSLATGGVPVEMMIKMHKE